LASSTLAGRSNFDKIDIVMKHAERTAIRLAQYYSSPNKCKQCGSVIIPRCYDGKRHKIAMARLQRFCGRACELRYKKTNRVSRELPTSKRCYVCKEIKPIEEFHASAKSWDKHQAHCKACRKSVDAWKYRGRTPEQQATYTRNERLRQRRIAEFVFAYLKQHPCVDCGESDPVVLEFDHVRGKKEYNISYMIKAVSLDKIVAEIEKCEVRCANCHRRVTAARMGSIRFVLLQASETLDSEAPPGTREEAGAIPAAGTTLPTKHLPG
jgi:ferredoxin